MSSTITNYSANIDTTFPVPGVDNDTSGFRKNFSAIKNSLDIASSEINDIQNEQASINNQLASVYSPTTLSLTSLTADSAGINSLTVSDSAVISGIAHISNSSDSALVVDGGATFNKDVYITGTLHITSVSNVISYSTSSSIDSTPVGAITPSTGAFTNLTAQSLRVTNSTSSTSKTTGALTVAGGLGVNGNIYTNLVHSGYSLVAASTDSVSTTTGALRVTGGAGIIKNLNVGGKIYSSGMYINGYAVSTVTSDLSDLQYQISSAESSIVTLSTLVNNNIIQYNIHNTSVSTNALSIDYSAGQYQKFLIDTTGLDHTNIQVTNWPSTGSYASIMIELKITGTSTGPSIYKEVRSQCTTYGSTSTTVDITDSLSGGTTATNGVGIIKSGWSIYSDAGLTTKIATVVSVPSSTRITIDTGLTFALGTSYYFAPTTNFTNMFDFDIVAPGGNKIMANTSLTQGAITKSRITTLQTLVYDLYTYDNGATVFVRNISVYQ